MEGEDRYTDKIVLACDRDKEATILKEVVDYEKSARDGVRENDFYSFWGGVPTKDGIAMLSVNDTLFRRMYKQLSALVKQLEADDSVRESSLRSTLPAACSAAQSRARRCWRRR